MKKNALISLLVLIGAIFLASSAYALPTLLTDQVTKMKFTNYENLKDLDESNSISVNDKFYGVLTLTTISDVDSTDANTTWTSLGSDEVTGVFQFTVASVDLDNDPNTPDTIPLNIQLASNESGVVTFTMDDTDFITLYYDDGSGIDFVAQGNEAASIASASDGDVWFSITGDDYLAGFNTTNAFNSSNFNWANLTENNTGYEIVPMIWKETLGSVNPFGSYTSDIYFETKLEFLTSSNYEWAYKSEDPVYLYATPEPNTLLLLGIGLIGFAGAIRRKA